MAQTHNRRYCTLFSFQRYGRLQLCSFILSEPRKQGFEGDNRRRQNPVNRYGTLQSAFVGAVCAKDFETP